MFKEEFWQDVKGLSGVPIFTVLIIVSFFLGRKQLALQLLVGLILAYAITSIIRLAYFRRRPDNEAYTNLFSKIDASSFPSLHTMRASVLATIFSFEFSNVFVTLLFAVCSIGVAVSRVITKRHYVSDVIAGLILGVIVGWFATFIS